MHHSPINVRYLIAPPYSGKTLLCRSLSLAGENVVDGDALVSARLGKWPHGDPHLLARTLAAARPWMQESAGARPPIAVWCPPTALIQYVHPATICVFVPDWTPLVLARSTNTGHLSLRQIFEIRAGAIEEAANLRLPIFSSLVSLAEHSGLTYRPCFGKWAYQGAFSVPDGPFPIRHLWQHRRRPSAWCVVKLFGADSSAATCKLWTSKALTPDELVAASGWTTDTPVPADICERTRPLAEAVFHDAVLGATA